MELVKLRELNADITTTEAEFDYRIRGDQIKFGRDESPALIYPYISEYFSSCKNRAPLEKF